MTSQNSSSSTTTPAWISDLSIAPIATDMAAADVGGVIDYSGLAKLLTDLAATLTSSSLTSAEFADLNTIAGNLNNGLSTSSYLTYVFDALVKGNAANAEWTGGAANAATLGNLAAGSSQVQLDQLIGKWFLGTDLPSSSVTMSPTTLSVKYALSSNPLFGSAGPVIGDVNQGDLGDCYFLASCAEVASQNGALIERMFTNNGNGAYGVRFYFNGVPEYVTVNLALPSGSVIFNSASDIWASLAEKAWAEAQAINGETGNSSVAATNSWTAIGNGGSPLYALEALTGATKLAELNANGSSWQDWTVSSSFSTTAYQAAVSSQTLLQTLMTELSSHDDVVIGSNTNATDASGKSTLVASHAFSVYGYDSATGMLEVRNPWGTEAGQTWDTTFEVSLATLLQDGDQIYYDNAGAAPTPITVAQYLGAVASYDSSPQGIAIADTSAAVSSNISVLNADAHIDAITLTDSGTPTLNLTAVAVGSDKAALAEIVNTAYAIKVSDTAANLLANLDAVAANIHIGSITLTDAQTPTLSLAYSQFADDASVFSHIVNPFELVVTNAPNSAITALSANPNVASFISGTVQYLNSASADICLSASAAGVSVALAEGSGPSIPVAAATLQFSDTAIQTQWLTGAANLPSSQMASLTELYLAYFDRAPDALGLDYWASQAAQGMSLPQIAASFSTQAETVALYPANLSNQTFVTDVYQNVLGRAPDAAGFAYWVNQLQTGAVAKSTFILAVINGAFASTGSPADASYLTSKELVGAHFAITDGLTNITQAHAVMNAYTGTAASITVADALADTYLADVGTASGANELVIKLVGSASSGATILG